MTAARSEWMLYGAYGRTGRLILDEALRREQRPVLAGRDATRLGALGRSTGLTTRCVNHAAAILETGEGYRAAAHAALRAVELQLRDIRIGALTPVQAFGLEPALLVPDTRIQEL